MYSKFVRNAQVLLGPAYQKKTKRVRDLGAHQDNETGISVGPDDQSDD